MNDLISAVEIALLIILPIVVFYQNKNISAKLYSKHVVILYLIWFFTYALLHELCHLLGVWIAGVKVIDYQLMPKFWLGEYKTGYINTVYQNNWQEFTTVIMPYLRDFILLIIGYHIFKRNKVQNIFSAALIIILFILSPLFDVVNNYFAFVLGAHTDFYALKNSIGSIAANLIGIFLSLFAISVSYYVIFIKGKAKT